MLQIFKTVFCDNKPHDWPLFCFNALVWQFRKRRGHVFDTRLENGAIVRVYPSTAYSGIFYTRYPEGYDLRFIREHSDLSDVFVDVGSNVGLFAASLFDKFKRVVCFEPSPSSFRALEETCALNPAVKCELHNIGVGDQKDELFFEDQFAFSTTSRFVEKQGENTMRIPVDTLDQVLAARFDSLVMKIDVEGFEEKVFLGADQLFTDQRVKLVMFERLGRTNLTNIRIFLEDRGYVVFRVVDGMKIATDDTALAEPCVNLFSCPATLFLELSS